MELMGMGMMMLVVLLWFLVLDLITMYPACAGLNLTFLTMKEEKSLEFNKWKVRNCSMSAALYVF